MTCQRQATLQCVVTMIEKSALRCILPPYKKLILQDTYNNRPCYLTLRHLQTTFSSPILNVALQINLAQSMPYAELCK